MSGLQPSFDDAYERSVEWVLPLPALHAQDLLIVTACDAAYLGHALALLRSVDVFSPGLAFLLHLVNPAEKDLARVRALAAALKQTRLACSLERVGLTRLDAAQRRTYYACSRFQLLSERLPELVAPVLCLDADSLVVAAIDHNFSDKINAEFCISRRDLKEAVPDDLAVANGSIWMRPTPGATQLVRSAWQEMARAFVDGSAAWYLDQAAMARQVRAAEGVHVYNLKAKYADWNFGDASIVWAGKGPRKYNDMRFVILQALLSDDAARSDSARHAARLLLVGNPDTTPELQRKLAAARAARRRAALFLPRLDLPWKAPLNPAAAPPRVAPDTLALRLHWKEFAIRLANALERAGMPVDVIEIPAWQIDEARVAASGAQLALIPHRCRHDFAVGETPVCFYMQEFFRWVFVVDPLGWGPSGSHYPFKPVPGSGRPGGPFDRYRLRLQDGSLGSKFAQPARRSRAELVAAGELPSAAYIFFPLQVPHDQSIAYFSDIGEAALLEALAAWCAQRGVALVLKPHPVNPKAMRAFEPLRRRPGVWWSEAHVEDLIAHATAVYTLNSGVGFEALLQIKPVVSFARTEYDCVSIRASTATLDEAWAQVQASDPTALEARYRDFVDSFLRDCAFDLSAPDAAQARFDAWAAQTVARCG